MSRFSDLRFLILHDKNQWKRRLRVKISRITLKLQKFLRKTILSSNPLSTNEVQILLLLYFTLKSLPRTSQFIFNNINYKKKIRKHWTGKAWKFLFFIEMESTNNLWISEQKQNQKPSNTHKVSFYFFTLRITTKCVDFLHI